MSYGSFVHEAKRQRELDEARANARRLRDSRPCPGSSPWPDADTVRSLVGDSTFLLWLSSIHVHPDGSLGCDPQRVGWVRARFGLVVGEVVPCGGRM